MNAAATRLEGPPRKLTRPLPPQDGPRGLGFEERLALFVCALHRDRALELLDGLASGPRVRARSFARAVADWDSSTRQARLTRELGLGSDAAERVQALIVEAPAALRVAIVEALPEEWRARYPHLLGNATCAPTPLARAIGARLVRETLRPLAGRSSGAKQGNHPK